MARGDFLSGLSKGIFSELNNQQQLQTQKDFASKQGLVQLLTGLADKVEPESLPLLMGHIWDTMGIKQQSSGKGLRGFLDAFSGMPNRSVEDQLGTKFRDLTKGMVGPQEAKDVRLRNNIAQKGIPGLVNAAPDSAYGQKAAMDAQGLKNKMVFRDPYQQKIEEIEARYGSQLQNQLYMQQQRNDAAANLKNLEYENKRKLDQENYERQTNKGIDQVAKLYMGKDEIRELPVGQRWPAAREMARQSLSGERNLKLSDIQSRIDLRKDVGAKMRSEAKAGGSPSQVLSEKRFAYTKQVDRNEMQEKHNQAEAALKTLNEQLEEKGKALDATAKMFPGGMMNREQLATSAYSTMAGNIGDQIREYNKIKKDRDAAQATLDTKRKEMEDFDTQEYGKPKAVRPTLPTSGKRPLSRTPTGGMSPVAPPGGQTFDATTQKPGVEGNTIKVRADRAQARGWMEKQEVSPSYLKGTWIVGEMVTESGPDGKPIQYRVLRRK